jgi:glycosyltransferase involved in cell wall biosynthesis
MDRRLPIVASRVGGVPEIVHDGTTGILIDPGRPEQLKAAILRLHESPELRQRLGANGYELAKGYTAHSMAQKYLALYRSIAAGGDRASS